MFKNLIINFLLFLFLSLVSNADSLQNLFDRLNQTFEANQHKPPFIKVIDWMGNDFVYDEGGEKINTADLISKLTALAKKNPNKNLIIIVRDKSDKKNFNLSKFGDEVGNNPIDITILTLDPPLKK